eukprot:GHVU01152605.1.p2 GENE.GHVU01152605.1~~GHVU01152605.1.p2  ORF type:complete len:151 (+),score=24.03 GHVU01152605.1:2508-2960(+)
MKYCDKMNSVTLTPLPRIAFIGATGSGVDVQADALSKAYDMPCIDLLACLLREVEADTKADELLQAHEGILETGRESGDGDDEPDDDAAAAVSTPPDPAAILDGVPDGYLQKLAQKVLGRDASCVLNLSPWDTTAAGTEKYSANVLTEVR